MGRLLLRFDVGCAGDAPPRRSSLRIGLLAIGFALVLARPSAAARPPAETGTPSPERSDRATTRGRSTAERPSGAAPFDIGRVSRAVKRFHGFHAAVGCDDPDDDETSDDPADDDDAGEGLNARPETEPQVVAWAPAMASCAGDLETSPAHCRPAPSLLTPFRTLQRLRC